MSGSRAFLERGLKQLAQFVNTASLAGNYCRFTLNAWRSEQSTIEFYSAFRLLRSLNDSFLLRFSVYRRRSRKITLWLVINYSIVDAASRCCLSLSRRSLFLNLLTDSTPHKLSFHSLNLYFDASSHSSFPLKPIRVTLVLIMISYLLQARSRYFSKRRYAIALALLSQPAIANLMSLSAMLII